MRKGAVFSAPMPTKPPSAMYAAVKKLQADHLPRLAAEIRAATSRSGDQKWRKHQGRRTPEQLALLILDCVIRPRPDDEKHPPARQAVAMDIAKALGLKDSGRSSWTLMLRVGIGLLDLAARVELIEDIRRKTAVKGEPREPWRIRLTPAAEANLQGYIDKLSELAEVRDDPLLERPTGPVFVKRNPMGRADQSAGSNVCATALEVLRGTRWRVNRFIFETMKATMADSDLQFLYSGLQDNDWKSRVKRKDRLLAFATAARFRDKEFYFDVYCDFRGRVYQSGALRWTGASPAVQSLLEFADGEKVLDDKRTQGALHLAAYLAGVWGQKGSIEKIAKWTLANESMLLATARDPLKRKEWRRLDEKKRWPALAACDAWRRFREGQPVHLPCSFDATTSGLQVYALLMRDEELGAKVGLLEGTEGTFYDDVAAACPGETRATAKSVGIPLFYGAGKDLTAEALAEDVGGKATAESVATRNLRLRKTIETLAPSFMSVRKWLSRQVAPAFAEVDKALTWKTPTGFAVIMDYREPEGIKVETYAQGRRIKLVMQHPSKDLKHVGKEGSQAGSIAANVIHSLDASLLIATINEGSRRRHGFPAIKNWAVVHDSFGVHPNHASHLRVNVAKQAIWEVFANDWLTDLHAQFNEQAGIAIPPPPAHPATFEAKWRHGWEALTAA